MYSSLHISSQRHVTDSSKCLRLFGITRTAHHLPSSITHTSHSQCLHAWLIVFLKLSGHNDTSNVSFDQPSTRSVSCASTGLDAFPILKFAKTGTLTVCKPIQQHRGAQLAHMSSRRRQYAFFYRQFGITQEKAFFAWNMELALEILCHMLASKQPRLSSHVPSASMPSTTRQIQRVPLLLVISTTSPGFVLRERSSNNGKTSLSISCQAFNSIGHVFQNTGQVILCTFRRVQIIRPA